MTEISATPQRLYLMQLGTATMPLATGQTLKMVHVCYLVQTSDGKNILIDSGLPAEYQPPPGMPATEQGKNVIEQLAELGLRPARPDIARTQRTRPWPSVSAGTPAANRSSAADHRRGYVAAPVHPGSSSLAGG